MERLLLVEFDFYTNGTILAGVAFESLKPKRKFP